MKLKVHTLKEGWDAYREEAFAYLSQTEIDNLRNAFYMGAFFYRELLGWVLTRRDDGDAAEALGKELDEFMGEDEDPC